MLRRMGREGREEDRRIGLRQGVCGFASQQIYEGVFCVSWFQMFFFNSR